MQLISGRGGPSRNEMEVGHAATKRFLVNVEQNQGRLITIAGTVASTIAQQDLPAGTIVCNLLQLRVLSGGNVHLTLFAQDAAADPQRDAIVDDAAQAAHEHARGIYPIAEFHFATQWNVNDEYLELPIGQLPLPNDLQGQALAGDYGVLQSFVVNVENPLSSAASDRDLRKPARRTRHRHLSDRWRPGAIASSAAVFALQGTAIRRSRARVRARDDRHDARSRLEPSASPDLCARRRQRRPRCAGSPIY